MGDLEYKAFISWDGDEVSTLRAAAHTEYVLQYSQYTVYHKI